MRVGVLAGTAVIACLALQWPSGRTEAAGDVPMGSLRGVVRERSGKPVNQAMVKIRNLDRGITATVFSWQGNYTARELFPGKNEVSLVLPGYRESGKWGVYIAAGRESVLNLTLSGSPARPALTPADWIALFPDDKDGSKELVVNRCVNCHGPAEFVPKRFDRVMWKKVIRDMMDFGRMEIVGTPNYMSIPDSQELGYSNEQTERLAAYLTEHFGPSAPPHVPEPKPVSYRNARTDANVVMTQFDIPTPRAIPHNLNVDRAGNIWFVERLADKIGKLDPKTGKFTEFPMPAKEVRGHGILPDNEGHIWWTESRGNHLGRLDVRTGQMKRYPLPQSGSSPHTLYLGPDGLIWMTEVLGGRVAAFNPQTETFKEYIVPTRNSGPYGLVVDSHNHVWFCEFGGNKIGELDPATGNMREYEPPTRFSGPRRLNLDRQENVWFTEYNTGKIARLDRSTGKITEWDVPTKDSGPYDIVVVPRGTIWFDEFAANKLARFDPSSGQFTEYPLPSLNSQVRKMVVDPSGAVWMSEYWNSRMTRVVEVR